jgi:hypothetical protein
VCKKSVLGRSDFLVLGKNLSRKRWSSIWVEVEKDVEVDD